MTTNGNEQRTVVSGWTVTQAYVLAVVCLLCGITVGYLLRGSAPGDVTAATGPAPAALPPGTGAPATPRVSPEELKRMADKQAEPLLQTLKATPDDAQLLAKLGNLYYDAQQFKDAIVYYDRALIIQPGNTDVRTDLGTAYWFLGQADKAISEFQTALKTEPTKANALLNLGVVQWQGKMDAKGAAASWQKLLESNPNYEGRDKVEQLLAMVKQHLNVAPPSTAKNN